MINYDKLVRDKIPQIIESSNKKCDLEVVSNEEAFKYLDAKLDEEVQEFHEAKNLEELADIMEILFSLSTKLGYSEEDLLNKRIEKKNERGGFEKNIVLKKVYD